MTISKEKEQYCPTCHGTGYEEKSRRVKIKGTGRSTGVSIETCKTCNGTGKKKV